MNNKHNKKKFLVKGFKQAADSLKGSSYAQELFEEGEKPIPSVNPNLGYDPRTIYFSGVIYNLHQDSNKKAAQEPILTHIKCKHYTIPDTIETKLTVSSIFDPYFHVINSGEVVDASRNSEVVGDVIAALEPEYYGHTYNQHNEHCDESIA